MVPWFKLFNATHHSPLFIYFIFAPTLLSSIFNYDYALLLVPKLFCFGPFPLAVWA